MPSYDAVEDAIRNPVENALAHAPPGTEVVVKLRFKPACIFDR